MLKQMAESAMEPDSEVRGVKQYLCLLLIHALLALPLKLCETLVLETAQLKEQGGQ